MTEYHDWVGSGFPGAAKNVGTGTVANGSVQLETKEPAASGWTVDNQWALSLYNPDTTLHFELRTNISAPPECPFPFPTSKTMGDLQRGD
jgi:hypothetical protein